jgi:peptide deformylase
MKETSLRIKIFGDPALKKKSSPVKAISDTHRNILSRMSELMYAQEGVGLAAPQVGINEEMIVVDIGSGLYKLVNPRLVKHSGSQINQEGCLSLPGICVKVRRANSVLVDALDEEGKKVKIDAAGLLACVMQHEIDHLKGKLIVDYASFLERLKVKKKLEELKQRSRDEGLSEPESQSCQLQL